MNDKQIPFIIRLTCIALVVFILVANLTWFLSSSVSRYFTIRHQSSIVVPHSRHLHQLHHLPSFRWMALNKSVCTRDDISRSKQIVFLIPSGREHTSHRNVIRETWGSIRAHGDWTVRLVFLLGLSDGQRNWDETQNETRLIDMEYLLFGDIIQGSFVDSYRNLTYKTLMGYKWILDYCPSADFIVKTDDDSFVDIPRLLKLREEDLSLGDSGANIHCIMIKDHAPDRVVDSKWYVSEEEYPFPKYPDYCFGAMVGMTADLVEKLYYVHRKVKYLPIEDVFTGMMLEKAKMEANGTLNIIRRNMWSEYQPCMFGSCLKMHCTGSRSDGWRNFGTIAKIQRDADFKKNMKCLWNITQADTKVNAGNRA